MASKTSLRLGVLVVVIFLCTLVNYIDRVNISVTAPQMIEEYGWDSRSLGVVFSSFFWGYLLLQMPSGWLVDKYGGRRIMFGSTVLWALFTLLTTWPKSIMGLSIVRAALGAAEAPNMPALTALIGRHLPGRFLSRILGFNFSAIALGPLVATPFAVFFMINWGWRSVFYASAALTLLLAGLWWWSTKWAGVTDEAEIQARAGTAAAEPEKAVLVEKPFRSVEVWGFSLAWYSNAYVFYFFMFWLPTYLTQAKGFTLQEMAGLAVIPWLVLFVMMNVAGYLIDIVKRRSRNSLFWRRMIYAGAFLWCAAFLYPLQHVESGASAVALISLAFAGLAFNWPIAYSLPIEYSPPKAGIITAFLNSWGQVAGILAPIITGIVVAGGDWSLAFLVTTAFAVLGALLVGLTSRYSTGLSPAPTKLEGGLA
jgi:ACS family glucarate transporter-like MFS transporter